MVGDINFALCVINRRRTLRAASRISSVGAKFDSAEAQRTAEAQSTFGKPTRFLLRCHTRLAMDKKIGHRRVVSNATDLAQSAGNRTRLSDSNRKSQAS